MVPVSIGLLGLLDTADTPPCVEVESEAWVFSAEKGMLRGKYPDGISTSGSHFFSDFETRDGEQYP